MNKIKHAPINWKKEKNRLPGYIIILIWILFSFMLLGWVMCASLSTTKDIFKGNALAFPTGLHIENYIKAWNSQNVSVFFTNSLVYSTISCIFLILIAAPCAYILARFTFLGRKAIQNGFVAAMGVPAIMIVLPLFCLISQMGMLSNNLSNRFVLVFLYIGINIPYTVVFLLAFFANTSRSYEEAAAIDGCTPIMTFWRIMFPIARSGIITVTIFNFINIWNEYFLSLIFANSNEMRPVAVGLYSMINSMKYTGDYAGMFAAVVIVFLPTFILYIFLSEKIIGGITAGGLKG